MAATVAAAGTWTVRVDARRRLPATGIVWSADGTSSTIATASHVVERDEDISVRTHDGQERPATLLGRSAEHDLAVLRVDMALPAAPRAEDVAVGGFAFAIGRATGLSATSGVISAISRSRGRRRRSLSVISSDAAMFPGFSGGPLVDANGQLVGILSSHLGRGQTLALPVSEIEDVISALVAHGRVRHGYIGIAVQPVTLPQGLATTAGASQQAGLLVVGVDEDGPAARAGLMLGDIVLSIGGQALQHLDDVRLHVGSDAIGQEREVGLLRAGQPLVLRITAAEQAA
jgi:S1-C subfamily serine protease